MGKEVVCIFALLLAIFIITGAIAVEEETRETATGEETPNIEMVPEESTGDLCSISSPISGAIYNTHKILFNISSEKRLQSIKYRDYADNNSAWRTFCSQCRGYGEEKSFGEGGHSLAIKCRDSKGNEEIHELEFLNDYTSPRISKIKPSSGFTNGSDFSVKYTEDNLDSISLWIRNVTAASSKKPEVELFVMALCPYGLQFEKGIIPVMELFGEKADIKIRFIHYFMHGEEEEEETYRQLCIREEQPDKYLDYLRCFVKEGDYATCLEASDVNTRELDECFFNRAEDYYAEDSNLSEAYGVEGSPTLVINGEIVSSERSSADLLNTICSRFGKVPKECFECLSNQNPFPGFGDYDGFECGEEERGGWTQKQCPSGKNQECFFDVDLSEYDDGEIEYMFIARDLAGNVEISRPVKVKADTTPPVLNNPLSFWEQGSGRNSRYIYFDLGVTEENLEGIYYYYEDSKGREKHGLLCSSLIDGFCTKRKSFLPGDYELTIEVIDKAGNGEEEEIEFTVE